MEGFPNKKQLPSGLFSNGESTKNGIEAHECSNEQNPMLNPAVLEIFFQVCDLKDLRRFRLVCKPWHDLSLRRWRNEMIIIIAFDKYFDDRRDTNKRRRLHWKDVNILYETPTFNSKPFMKFRLANWEFLEEEPKSDSLYLRERRRILRTFWTHCGAWMRELELLKPTIKSYESFRETLVERAPNVVSLKLRSIGAFTFGKRNNLEGVVTQPNLMSLTILLGADAWEKFEDENWKPIPWFDLFASFPNCEELAWEEFHDIFCRQMMDDWNKLTSDGRHFGRKLKIKCFDINSVSDVREVEILEQFLQHASFTFQNLKIEANNAVGQTNIISEAGKRHQNNLEELTITAFYCRFYDAIPVTLPFLAKLKLSLIVVFNLDFLEFTPNLKELEVCSGDLQELLGRSTPKVLENIQLLRLNTLLVGSNVISDHSVIKTFSKWMPNLTTLKFPLNKTCFRAICEHMKGLRELEDSRQLRSLKDETITGIEDEHENRHPNITDLKYLRTFITKNEMSALTDKSVWKGFLECENLIFLEVALNEKASDEAFSAMLKRFPIGIRWSAPGNKEKETINEELKLKEQFLSKEFGIGFKL